ncbi:hypothetical protein DH2020_037000 [Rehmannia glutinosa]|uniref:Saccharopine dehydrogenase n=1 Tax=Rehmannia glutinosa TaxID=99300 RepID=A0ABR0V2Y5_REHGL
MGLWSEPSSQNPTPHRRHFGPELPYPPRGTSEDHIELRRPVSALREPVVSACVESGCDYLDICGEPEFMERMEASYHEKAVEKGSLVISACGFDSVPAEIGLLFHSRHWAGPSAPNRVEAYLSLESDKKLVGNFGTYESAVLGVANSNKLVELRRSRPKRARPAIPGPAPPKGSIIEHQKQLDLWGLKLPSADSIVVQERWQLSQKIPMAYPVLMKVSKTLKRGKPSGHLLGTFRKEGPSEDEVASATFKMWFVGQGFSDSSVASQGKKKPDTEVITRVMGPEIGYLTTPIILVQCALVVLNDRDNLPKGGVFTPGIVFGPTDLEKRLQENGISFDFISKKALST